MSVIFLQPLGHLICASVRSVALRALSRAMAMTVLPVPMSSPIRTFGVLGVPSLSIASRWNLYSSNPVMAILSLFLSAFLEDQRWVLGSELSLHRVLFRHAFGHRDIGTVVPEVGDFLPASNIPLAGPVSWTPLALVDSIHNHNATVVTLVHEVAPQRPFVFLGVQRPASHATPRLLGSASREASGRSAQAASSREGWALSVHPWRGRSGSSGPAPVAR